MMPLEFHVPPETRPRVSQMVCGGPPAMSTRLRKFGGAQNPSERLSGDQNRQFAPSVPVSGRETIESSGRIQILLTPSAAAVIASNRPSGEIAGGPSNGLMIVP